MLLFLTIGTIAAGTRWSNPLGYLAVCHWPHQLWWSCHWWQRQAARFTVISGLRCLCFFFFFSGDFKGGTCHCWKVIFFYIWKWKMEKGGMALLLSWTLFNWWIHVALCTDRSLNQCTTTSVYSYLQLVPRKAYTSQWHMPFLKIAVLLGGNASWPSWRSTSLPKSLNLITSSLRVVPTGAPWEMNC